MTKEEAIELVWKTADEIDNIMEILKNPAVPAALHIEWVKNYLPSLANNLKKAHIALSGENPWEGSPFDVKED